MEDLGLGHHFLSKLDELYKHTDLCDVILKATPGGAETDTGSIHLHSVILAAHSPAFRTLFTKEKAGRSRWTLFVRHESLEHWRTLVKFMYRGNLDINNHNVDVVCNLAQSYNIKRAVVLCDKFKTANRDVMYISSVNSNKQHYVSMQDVLSLKDSECDEVVDGPILRPDDSQQSDHADDSVEKRLVYNVDILYSNAYTCSGKRDRDHSQHQSCDGNEAPNTNEKQLEGQEICKTCKYSEREDKSQSEYKENSAEMSTSLSHNSSSRRPPQDSVFPTNTQISENTDTSPVHELLDNCGISLKMEVEEQDMFGNGYSVNDDSISVSGREEDRGNTLSTTDDRECRQRKEPEIHVRGGQLSAVTEGDDQSSQIMHGSPGIKQEQIWLQHTAPNGEVNHVSFDQNLVSSSTMSTSQDHSGMRSSAAVGEGMKNPSYLCSHSGFLGSNDNRLAMPTCHTHNNPLPPGSCGYSECESRESRKIKSDDSTSLNGQNEEMRPRPGKCRAQPMKERTAGKRTEGNRYRRTVDQMSLTDDQRKLYNEKVKLRMRAYRQRLKEKAFTVTSDQNSKETIEKRREIWRKQKRKQRAKLKAKLQKNK